MRYSRSLPLCAQKIWVWNCNSRTTAPSRHRRNSLNENRRALSALATSAAREVFDLLRDDLVAIEQELGRDSASGVSTITEIAEYLREGGGKRIRPTLLLLSAHALG